MSDKDTDPHNLPSVTAAERNQAAKRSFIPTWAIVGIIAVIVAVVLFGIYR